MNLHELADQAAALASTGVPVLPVKPDKSPCTLHGFRDAVADPQQARELFLRHPGARLVGIATGLASGLTIIDVDPDGFPWMGRNLRRLTPTRLHQTPRGYHLVYRTPDPALRNSVGMIARGIDIRGEAGCCNWYPATGGEIRDASEPAEFPKWVIRALARIKARREAQAAQRDARIGPGGDPGALERFVSRLTPGTRNQALFWAAARAGEAGISGAGLIQAAMAAGLDAIEAQRTVRSGLERGARDGARDGRRSAG